MTWRVAPAARAFVDPATGAHYVLRRGAVVVVPMISVHCNPRTWPDPAAFRPERFMEGAAAGVEEGGQGEGGGLPAMHFIPFGFGTRSCLGQVRSCAETALRA